MKSIKIKKLLACILSGVIIVITITGCELSEKKEEITDSIESVQQEVNGNTLSILGNAYKDIQASGGQYDAAN